jgi:hypothetical protein
MPTDCIINFYLWNLLSAFIEPHHEALLIVFDSVFYYLITFVPSSLFFFKVVSLVLIYLGCQAHA